MMWYTKAAFWLEVACCTRCWYNSVYSGLPTWDWGRGVTQHETWHCRGRKGRGLNLMSRWHKMYTVQFGDIIAVSWTIEQRRAHSSFMPIYTNIGCTCFGRPSLLVYSSCLEPYSCKMVSKLISCVLVQGGYHWSTNFGCKCLMV